MDDATQKLVDERLIAMGFYDRDGFIREEVNTAIREAVRTMPPIIDARGWIGGVQILRAAVEAAQRPPVSGDYTHVVNLARASEAADKGFDALVNYLADLPTIEEWRPPVSPEVDWSDTDRPHCVRCGERIWAGQMMTVLPSGLREHQDCARPYQAPEGFKTLTMPVPNGRQTDAEVVAWIGEALGAVGWEFDSEDEVRALLARVSRPPVSPEVREALSALAKDVFYATRDEGGTMHQAADRLADALLARWSFPSQPVYDEDAAAGFVRDLAEHGIRFDLNPTVDASRGAYAYVEYIGRIDRRIRERAVAALRGGELTREEGNRG